MKGPNFRLASGILLHLCDNVASSYINILWISFVSRPSLKDGERQFRPGLSKMEHRISVGIRREGASLLFSGQLITTSVTSHSNRSKLSLAWLV